MSIDALPQAAQPARPASLQTAGPLGEALAAYRGDETFPRWNSDWAWENYVPLTLHLAQTLGARRLLEVGGGRSPLFGASAGEHGLDLIVNDIDARELALLPEGFERACFDISGDLSARPELVGTCDMLVSRMVLEHVQDVASAWRNTHTLLRPGGVALGFFPTLYAWPYVLNSLLPGDVAKKLVQIFTKPDRSDEGGQPVFPPVYDWCFGSETKMRALLEPMGWSEIVVMPFWAHHYLDKIPLAREADYAFNWLAMKADWRAMTTYAYVLVRK